MREKRQYGMISCVSRSGWRPARAFVAAFFVLIFVAPDAVAQMANSQVVDATGEIVGYDRVREILRKRCVTCHNVDELRGDLNLADLPGIVAGSASGPVVVAGKPNQSSLFKSAAHLEDPVMPPNSPRIPARELDLLRRWIEGGLAEISGALGMAPARLASAPETSAPETYARAEVKPNGNSVLSSVTLLLRPAAIAALDVHASQDLAAVSGDRQAVLFKPTTGEFLGAVDFPEGEVTALRFSRDGQLLVVAGGVAGLSGRVVGFDVATGRRVFELADENDTILTVDLSLDGKRIAVGGPAKVVRIYDTANGKVVHTLRKHTDWILTVRFSPDGLLLASGDRFGGLHVWEPISGDEFHSLRGHVAAVTAIEWDAAGEKLVSTAEDGFVRTWNMHHGDLTGQWDAGVGAILSLATHKDLVVCGGRDNRIAVWQGPDSKLAVFEAGEQVERVGFSPATSTLIAADAAGHIHGFATEATAENFFDLKYAQQLPVDEAGLQTLLAKIDVAESEYAEQMKSQAFQLAESQQPQDASSAESSSKTMLTELTTAEKQLTALKTLLDQTQQAIASMTEEIDAADTALQKLNRTRELLRQLSEELQSKLLATEKQLGFSD